MDQRESFDMKDVLQRSVEIICFTWWHDGAANIGLEQDMEALWKIHIG